MFDNPVTVSMNFSIPSDAYNIRFHCLDTGEYTFEGFEALKEMVIPDFVIRIGEGAFNGCSGLSKITVGYSLSVIEDGAFDGCISLKEVVNKFVPFAVYPRSSLLRTRVSPWTAH